MIACVVKAEFEDEMPKISSSPLVDLEDVEPITSITSDICKASWNVNVRKKVEVSLSISDSDAVSDDSKHFSVWTFFTMNLLSSYMG